MAVRRIRTDSVLLKGTDMGLLDKALPRTVIDPQPTLKSPRGVYKALFCGMTDPFEYVSPWPNEKCRVCKGQGTGYNGEGECSVCHGTKKRTEQHAKLIYRLENGAIEEEEVNFKLAAGSTGQNGQTYSPTTLFVRLRALSGLTNPTEEQLDNWYTALQKPIKIPCQVIINDNKTASMLKITDVMAPRLFAPAPQQAAREVDHGPAYDDVPGYTDDDFVGLER